MRNSQKIRDIVKLQTGNIPSPKKYQMHVESKHTAPFCPKYPSPAHIKCIQNPFVSSTQPHPYQMHTEPFCLKYPTPPISNAYRTLLPQVPNPAHIKCIQNPFASSTQPHPYQMHTEVTEPFCLKYPTPPISNAYRTLLPQVPNPTHIKCIQNPFASSTQPHPYQMHTEPFCLKYPTPPISNAYRTLLPQVPIFHPYQMYV